MYAKEARKLSNENNKKFYDGEIIFVLSFINDSISIGESKCDYPFGLNSKTKKELRRLGYKVKKSLFGFEYKISW